MAFDQETHMESVRESVQYLADLQAAIWQLQRGDVAGMMEEIEAVGATAIARSKIGGICMEGKSGKDEIDECKQTGMFDRGWAPIPDGYHIWFSMPISTEWLVDLKDPWLWRIFWTLTRDPDKGIFWKGDNDPERHEFDKIIRRLYKTSESRTVKVTGEIKIYGSIPKRVGHLGGGSARFSTSLGAFEFKDEPKKPFNKKKLGIESFELEGRVFGGGNQDKQWREEEVDSDLKDEWLERLNAISPDIHFVNICAGGIGHVALRPYFSFNLGNEGNLPITWPQDKRDRLAEFIEEWFRDIAVVQVEDWFPRAERFGRTISFPHREKYVWYFNIYSPWARIMMDEESFDGWWERVIERFEGLPAALPDEFKG